MVRLLAWFTNARPEKMYCCHGLRNLIATAGQAGISVLVVLEPGSFRFRLQSRAVSKEEEDRMSKHPVPLPLQENLKTSLSMALNYCPFCGCKLRSLVGSSTWRKFAALAREHERLKHFNF
jgi:hypothetical protein